MMQAIKWGMIVGSLGFIALNHYLEKKDVKAFEDRWSYGRRLYDSNETLEKGFSWGQKHMLEHTHGKKITAAIIKAKSLTKPQKKRIDWENYRKNCGEIHQGACYITKHNIFHWRGNFYWWMEKMHLKLIMKYSWFMTLEYRIGQFIRPIRFEKNGDVTEGYRFMPWTRKVTGAHSDCTARFA